MKHGADILSYQHLYDGKIVDFSSNINPLGFPEGLEEYLNKEMKALLVYPDIRYRGLKESIANYLKCDKAEVLVGNGAVEIINNISMAFSRIVVGIPCFSEYVQRAIINGKEVLSIVLDKDFEIKEDTFKDKIRKNDLIILGNPNNPTGKRIKETVLLKLVEQLEAVGAYLLLDEAFYEFCSLDYDSIELFRNKRNVFVIRAATKFFALPGIRLGYAFCEAEFCKKIEEVFLPWSVNAFADAAGRYIFKDKDYIYKSKLYIKEQREFMNRELKTIKDIENVETEANFALIKLLKVEEEELFHKMLEKGLLIRKASSFEGLNKSYIRIAIKGFADNNHLLNTFKQILFK